MKLWAQLAEHGTDKLGALITQNCAQAAYLGKRVAAEVALELRAPVSMNICCFRYTIDGQNLDSLNDEIVIQLQIQGIAAPSTTMIGGENAIRVNITNHRTTRADLDILVDAVLSIGAQLVKDGTYAET